MTNWGRSGEGAPSNWRWEMDILGYLLDYLLLADVFPAPFKVPVMGLLVAVPFIAAWVMMTKFFEDVIS